MGAAGFARGHASGRSWPDGGVDAGLRSTSATTNCCSGARSRTSPTTSRPTPSCERIRCSVRSREHNSGDHGLFTASLDHTIWFHAPLRADEWHLYDFSCHRYVGGRGLGDRSRLRRMPGRIRRPSRRRSSCATAGGSVSPEREPTAAPAGACCGDDGTDLVTTELVLLVQRRRDREQGGVVPRSSARGPPIRRRR